jgi:hypothetical protein
MKAPSEAPDQTIDQVGDWRRTALALTASGIISLVVWAAVTILNVR